MSAPGGPPGPRHWLAPWPGTAGHLGDDCPGTEVAATASLPCHTACGPQMKPAWGHRPATRLKNGDPTDSGRPWGGGHPFLRGLRHHLFAWPPLPLSQPSNDFLWEKVTALSSPHDAHKLDPSPLPTAPGGQGQPDTPRPVSLALFRRSCTETLLH